MCALRIHEAATDEAAEAFARRPGAGAIVKDCNRPILLKNSMLK
jgi:hypothetical protein